MTLRLALWVPLSLVQTAAFATDVPDPVAFVKNVYARIAKSATYEPPGDIYTPRLKALFDEDKRRANGEVGCIDFDFWTNAQDWHLKNVEVTGKPVPGKQDRMLVVATFVNGTPQQIQLDFEKVGGKWLLDDARSMAGERWTLSKLLKCW